MKRSIAVILAVLMLCSTLVLSSCSMIENIMDIIEDKLEDKIEDEINKAKESMENESELSVEVDDLNGKSAKEVYTAAETFILGLTEYEINGSRYMKLSTTGSTPQESDINFKTKVAKNSAYSELSKEGDGSLKYYYVDGYKYWVSGNELIDDPESMNKEDFIKDETVSFDFSSFGNWANVEYLDLGAEKFSKLGDEYTLTVTLTDADAKEYYEEKVGLSIVTSAKLTLELKFDKNGTLKSYKYDTEFEYEADGATVTNHMRWNIFITKTSGVAEITLPAGINKVTGSGGGSSNGGTSQGTPSINTTPITVNIDGTDVTIGDMDGDGDVDDLDVFIQRQGEFTEETGDGVRTNADVLLCMEWTFAYWKNTVLPEYESMYASINN